MSNNKVQKMISIALLSSLGTVLQFIAFPVLPAFQFLTIDFSDIPITISMFLFGPVAGITTSLIRSLLHLFLTGPSPQNLIGDGASFLASIVFTMPMYYFFQKGKHKMLGKILGVSTGIIALTVFMSVANYFVITPAYLKIFGVSAEVYLQTSLIKYVAIGIVPFNLIKGGIVSILFLILHSKLLPWLQKKQKEIEMKNSESNHPL